MGGMINRINHFYNPAANVEIYDNLKLLQNCGYIGRLTINEDAFYKTLFITFTLTNQKIGSINHKFNLSKYNIQIIRNERYYTPRFYIVSPKLKNGTPHLNWDGSICLYHPDNFEWHEFNSINDTLITWLYGWVYFYEVWLIKNVWLGPEAKH